MVEFNSVSNGLLFTHQPVAYGLNQNVDLIVNVGPVTAVRVIFCLLFGNL